MSDLQSLLSLHGYLPSVLHGAWVTVQLSLLSLLVALVLGMLAANGKLSSNPLSKGLAMVYTTVVRGIPDLVLMMMVFYGGQILVNSFTDAMDWQYFEVSAFLSGVLSIGFIYGAYMGETFRGAIQAVDKGQLMAGRAYGMTHGQVYRRILVPLMMRHALPGIGNNWLVLLKGTALVSLIGLEDMMRKAQVAAGSTHKPFTFYLSVALLFLLFTSLSMFVFRRLERRYRLVEREAA
jgi:His/Glu/Gln/Arg/opine family amino acid ABC transporter permease subunit